MKRQKKTKGHDKNIIHSFYWGRRKKKRKEKKLKKKRLEKLSNFAFYVSG
jgi:hypothetical protein